MKPFNSLEPVQKQDGRKARIIGWDAKGIYPITALVEQPGGGEDPESFTAEGCFSWPPLRDNPSDLINVPKPPTIRKVRLWIAVWGDGSVNTYTNREPSLSEGFKAVKEFNLEVEVP